MFDIDHGRFFEFRWFFFIVPIFPRFCIFFHIFLPISIFSSIFHFTSTFKRIDSQWILSTKITQFLIQRLPWNQKTIGGYAAEIFVNWITGEAYFITTGAILLLCISMCLQHRSFYERFQHSLHRLNSHEIQTKLNQEELLRDLIHFHITVKEYKNCSVFCFAICIVCKMKLRFTFTNRIKTPKGIPRLDYSNYLQHCY